MSWLKKNRWLQYSHKYLIAVDHSEVIDFELQICMCLEQSTNRIVLYCALTCIPILEESFDIRSSSIRTIKVIFGENAKRKIWVSLKDCCPTATRTFISWQISSDHWPSLANTVRIILRASRRALLVDRIYAIPLSLLI